LHRVADDLEHRAAVRVAGRAQEGEVPLDRRPHRAAVPLPPLRGALDVGEQEGDGA
jgi:hypothetical protein